ncbi:MAG: hypothetical protein QM758_00755 [Armatimonas sp.]
MGSGSFDSIGYSARAAARTASGRSVFTHDADVAAGRAAAVHEAMDLRNKLIREARDNDDNPFSFPIAVMFDVTGSMRDIPDFLQKELGKLMGFVLGEGIVDYPQILFGAVGDAFSDQAPLQMGEFEADDALVEKCLSQIYLEGGGGGSHEESYELAMYHFAKHVKTDAWEKRGTKGALFLIGDENYYSEISADAIRRVMGEDIGQDVTTAQIAAELQRRWNVFLIRPGGTYHFDDVSIERAWKEILPPQHVIRCPDKQQIVPLIAMTVGAIAGRDLASSADALARHGFDKKLVTSAAGELMDLAKSGTLVAAPTTAIASTGGGAGAARL